LIIVSIVVLRLIHACQHLFFFIFFRNLWSQFNNQNKTLSFILLKHNKNKIIMSRSSQRITRLQICEIICQYSQSSAAPPTSEALNVLQSLVTTGLQQDVCLQKEQNFDISVPALAYIKSLFLQDQYPLLKELNITLNQFQVSVLDIQSDIVDYLQQEKLWRRYMNERTFLKAWDDTIEKIRKHRSQQDKIKMTVITIQQYWGDHVWERYLINLNLTYAKVNEIQKLAKECRDWGVASQLVLTVVYWHLEFRTREQQKLTQVHPSDWIQAVSEYQSFWNWNFQLASDTDLYDHSDLNAAAKHLLPCSRSSPCSSFTLQQCLEPGSFMLQLIKSSDLSSRLLTFTTLMRTWCVTTFNDDDDEENDNQSVQQQKNFILTRFQKEHDETESQNSHRASFKLMGLNPRVLPQSESLQSWCIRCADISSCLIDMIDQTDKQIPVVIATIEKLIDEENDESCACYSHQKKLANTTEFQVRLLQSDAIDSHLWTYWNNRFRIPKLKTDSATWQWFWVIDHSSQPADNMSIYNYMHHDLFLTIEVGVLLNWIDIMSRVWERDESVVISNAFSWLYEFDLSMPTMFNIIDNKFQMYHHHLQEVEERQNYSWLWNMFYGVIQQAIRQLSAYYLIYVVLCSDHNHCLIFYLYYDKFQAASDKTFFRHIDLNILKLVSEEKSQYMIQGSVSLDNEKKKDCTEMLLKMQYHLDNWWKDVQQRLAEKEKKPSDELIHWITYNEWTKEDIQKYKIDFVSQSCCCEEVRVSLPHLPHRAQAAQRIWQTILFWYVEISEDHETLNISEFETWSQLLSAHHDLVFGSSSLFTLHNMFGASSYSFSAAVQLTGLSSISDALVGRVCWTNLTVISHLCDLLDGNDAVRNAYLHNWTITAKQAIKT